MNASLDDIKRRLVDGDAAGARDLANAVLRESPDAASAWSLLAQALMLERDWASAEDAAARGLELTPDDPESIILLGRIKNNRRELPEAEKLFERATELAPRTARAWNYLGHVRRGLGDLEGALASLNRAIQLQPAFAAAYANLGTVFMGLNRFEDAEACFRKVLALQPGANDSRYHLGLSLHEQGRYEEAIAVYRQCLSTESEATEILSNLGAALEADGHLDEAYATFEKVLRIEPGHPAALAAIAGLLDLRGRPEDGLQLIETSFPEDTMLEAPANLIAACGQLMRRAGRQTEGRELLEAWLERHDKPAKETMPVLYTLADILDSQGEYDRAFEHYARANRLRHSRFDPRRHERNIDRIVAAFDDASLQSLPRAANESETPVFIVGMPRSGTSLVEQILDAHTDVVGAGELRTFGVMAVTMSQRFGFSRPYPECLPDLSTQHLDELAATYSSRTDETRGNAKCVTDKMWQNFEHMGLISLVFPRARVIHCVRDPLDIGLSCFCQSFGTAGPPFSYDLENIGHYYRGYERLMEHWRSVLKSRFLEFRYEDLVKDPEPHIRELLDFMGLEWDPACLNFHETGRTVRTASHDQVTKPIYTSSVGRHKHYDRHLLPLKKILDAHDDQ